MSIYELVILGSISTEDRARLLETIVGMVSEFELTLGEDLQIRDEATFAERNIMAATAVVYFGGLEHVGLVEAQEALSCSLPIIPTFDASEVFEAVIPECLRASNGLRRRPDDPEMIELATSLLECVGLLKRQRRVFISYRRTESRIAAVDLHDLLIARGFDVFLDTHDLRPGEPFQEVLWHRLCDSDVLIMLDTPTYYASKWTRQELARARAKEIHIYRVVWPGHESNRQLTLAETMQLDADDIDADGSIIATRIDEIALGIERLRSRSVAARYMSMTGRFRSEIEKIGAKVEGVGAHRAISVRLEDGRKIWAYPIIGIPTAETLHDIVNKSRKAAQRGAPILVYDDIGIRDSWIKHLQWLDENIRSVKSIKLKEAAWVLAEWEA